MKRILSVALVLLVVASFGVGSAAAQPEIPTHTPSPDAGQNQTHERIDNATVLVSSSFDNGTATVVIESEIPQEIVLSDAGDFVQGGEVDQRTVFLEPGERARISMPVTKTNGFAGLSISTQETLYAVPLENESTTEQVSWFQSESTWRTVQTAAVGGASGVLVVALLLAYRLRDGGKERTERIA